ncbi:MAG: OmpA family protein [Candidatus Aminicenantes bacterium]
MGHTDNAGGYEMNLDLSEAQANALVEKLVNEFGVSREQLKPVGMGPAFPVSTHATEERRARNRRVEIVKM